MTTKDTHNGSDQAESGNTFVNLGRTLLLFLKFPTIRRGPAIATGIAFMVTIAVLLNNTGSDGVGGDIRDFEVGKVAERDITATQSVSYTDEVATHRRIEAQQHLVPAVFKYDSELSAKARNDYGRFAMLSRSFFSRNDTEDKHISLEAYRTAILSEFPGEFSGDVLDILFQASEREDILELGLFTVDHFMENGIFNLPETGLGMYNSETVELLRSSESRTGRERVNFSRMVTLDTLHDAVDRYTEDGFLPIFRIVAFDLIKPFIKENVFFSAQDTAQRVAEISVQVEPEVKYIEAGQRIIKKGFIITEEDMLRLHALNFALSKGDPKIVISKLLISLLMYGFFIFLGGVRTIGRKLTNAEIYLLSALTAFYLIGASLAKNLFFNTEFFPVSILIPSALTVMLPSILIGAPLALAWAMVLPLGAFLSGSFDVAAYIFALVSGIVASYALQGAEKRMDLVKAGLIIAAANAIAVIAILLSKSASWEVYPGILFWSAFNGIASGMLVLGILPPLEHALNAATTFRLIELSDLNSPMIKRLFTSSPGTYSHSIMVANLAEAACQEIGANSLLARVAAYYHDIGKMEQPDYFVENQTSSYNKHIEITPQLSATIIKTHVKVGVEKARVLGLPQQVIDIIAEHHGNSVITWFYNEALKQDPHANIEDFSYPGNPPRSRESAVVMLADMSEAAVRTLDKPNPQEIEKFLQQLIDAKVEHGQLAESELTFRELEIIKQAFVRVLVGYYHSRIKYPKLPKAAVKEVVEEKNEQN